MGQTEEQGERFEIRPAEMSRLKEMMDIYDRARKFMAEHGNPTQWPPGYPSEEMIAEAIGSGRMYLCMEGEKIRAVFYYHMGEEANYRDIREGSWLDDEPYGVVHQIASEGGVRGAGSFCLKWAWEQCKNLRIDTHRDNVVMQNLLGKLGFRYCGIIPGRNGGERLAYQKRKE